MERSIYDRTVNLLDLQSEEWATAFGTPISATVTPYTSQHSSAGSDSNPSIQEPFSDSHDVSLLGRSENKYGLSVQIFSCEWKLEIHLFLSENSSLWTRGAKIHPNSPAGTERGVEQWSIPDRSWASSDVLWNAERVETSWDIGRAFAWTSQQRHQVCSENFFHTLKLSYIQCQAPGVMVSLLKFTRVDIVLSSCGVCSLSWCLYYVSSSHKKLEVVESLHVIFPCFLASDAQAFQKKISCFLSFPSSFSLGSRLVLILSQNDSTSTAPYDYGTSLPFLFSIVFGI